MVPKSLCLVWMILGMAASASVWADGHAGKDYAFGHFSMRAEIMGQNGSRGEERSLKKSEADAVELSKRYLSLANNQRVDLVAKLKGYTGSIDSVIQALRPPIGQDSRKGEIRKEHFTAPGLRKKYPDDLLYFYVPKGYDEAKPFGLMIFMHGGASKTPREKAGVIVSSPETDPNSYALRPRVEDAPFITVAPSALKKGGGGKRWNVPEADGYIAAVIEECEHRFNMDPDRVFLGGHSMGAYGAYHLCQRFNDRIAGGLFSAGAWKVSDFGCLTGTGVFLIHGKNDTAPGASPVKGQKTRQASWTGVAYARAAVELLKRDNIPHVYSEHEGGHAFKDGDEGIADFIRLTKKWRRDPFFKKVVAVSPRGSWLYKAVTATPHTRWISINIMGAGKIKYDAIRLSGPNIAKSAKELAMQGYSVGKRTLRGGRVVGNLQGDNTIELKTENVQSFSLWLHPKMVDFSKPVHVIVNGKRNDFDVKASLLDALRSYERKRDWGLIYHVELVIEVK